MSRRTKKYFAAALGLGVVGVLLAAFGLSDPSYLACLASAVALGVGLESLGVLP